MNQPPRRSLQPIGTVPRRRRSWLRAAGGVLVLAVAVVGAYGFYHLFLEQGPAAVGTAVPVIPSGAAAASPALTDGTWTIDASIGTFADFTDSWVGYRVQEQLVGLGGSTAVGRTPRVTGALTLAGTSITTVSVTADLATLTSSEPLRDGQLGHQGIETDTYPTATFRLTQPIDLGELPADGVGVAATAVGDLTIHGVTQNVQVPVTATRTGDVIGVSGSIDVVFADYGMTPPSSFKVLSIDDHGVMEFLLFFREN